MASNAAEYADSITADIQAHTEEGYPFGILRECDGAYVSDLEELRIDYPEDWGDGDNLDEIPEGWREASGMDYLSDVLDIQYTVGSDRQYRSARVCIAFGGPTAWIDTRTEQLEVAWWSAPEYRDLPRGFVSGLDDALEELWGMGA